MNLIQITTTLFLGIAFLFSCQEVSAQSQSQYCATITASEASGATGYVAVQVGGGQAKYSFNLDLSDFVTTSCPDYSQGISYHVHVNWNNSVNAPTSAANGVCKTIAGGHYDPNFGCSNYSSVYTTGCLELQRQPVYGYWYACNPSNYAAGHYSFCETGDISSKNGVVYLDENQVAQVSLFTDYQPIYSVNYNSADQDSGSWISFVFHCAANNNRLVCAKFSPTNLSPCQNGFNAMSTTTDSDDDKVSQTDANNAIILSTVLCTVGGLVIGMAIAWFCFPRGSKDPLLGK
jgi:hypothetical protein